MYDRVVRFLCWVIVANCAVIPGHWNDVENEARHQKQNVIWTLRSGIATNAAVTELPEISPADFAGVLREANNLKPVNSTEEGRNFTLLPTESNEEIDERNFFELLLADSEVSEVAASTRQSLLAEDFPATSDSTFEEASEFGNLSNTEILDNLFSDEFNGLGHSESLDKEVPTSNFPWTDGFSETNDHGLVNQSSVFETDSANTKLDLNVSLPLNEAFSPSAESFNAGLPFGSQESVDGFSQIGISGLQELSENQQLSTGNVTSKLTSEMDKGHEQAEIPASSSLDQENFISAASGEPENSNTAVWLNVDFADASELPVSPASESTNVSPDVNSWADGTSSDTPSIPRACPPPGICFLWFLASEECSLDEHCPENQTCCKIRCSTICVDVIMH